MDQYQEKLEQLRASVDEVDQELLALLVKRREITNQLAELKAEQGVALYAPDRESELLNKARKNAIDKALSPELVEDLLKRIIRDNYTGQDNLGYRCVNPKAGKVVIIGGGGQLGAVFVRKFKKSGYQVEVMEQGDWPNAKNILQGVSLVIVSVPIKVTEGVIAELANLPDSCVLADITSIKEKPLAAMLAVHQGPVVGLHPMFGPDVSNLVKQSIVVCHGRGAKDYQWLIEQLAVWGAKTYEVSAKEHDQAMSLIQVMRHFGTICYGNHLRKEGANIEQLVEMSSPIYRLELMMVGRLFAQNPELYRDIIFSNTDNIAMMRRYARRFLEHLDMVELGNKESFVDSFLKTRAFFGEFAQGSLKQSKKMLQKAEELKT